MNISDYEGKRFHFDASLWEAPEQYQGLDLYQIGDLCCEGDFETGRHMQVCYEISYVISGKGVFYLDGKTYPVEKGNVFLCLPGQEHDFVADREDPLRFYYLAFNFSEKLARDEPLAAMESILHTVLHPLRQDSFSMGTPFSALLREFISPGEFSRLMIETYMIQILILTCRDFAGFPGKKPECSVDYKNKAVCEVISYIDNNILFMTGMTDIAKRLNYSYSYLSHLFTAEMGISMQEYYNKRRIETALAMLKEEDVSISEIALSLQYQSIHSFSKAFKKAVGFPPSKCRGQGKNKGPA